MTKLTHFSLIEIARSLGYDPLQLLQGICAGFSIKGIEAFLSGDLKSFEERMVLLQSYPDLKEKIEQIKEKAKSTTLDEEEIKLIEVLAFFEQLLLYHDPITYFNIFKKPFTQSNVEEISSFAQSKIIEQKKGLVKIGNSIAVYSLREFSQYLQQLWQLLQECKQNIAFSVSCQKHKISVCYDAICNEWLVIDANAGGVTHYPGKQNDAALFYLLSQVICQQASCLNPGRQNPMMFLDEHSQFILALDFFATGDQQAELRDLFQSFQKTKTYQEIHTLTNEKIQFEQHIAGMKDGVTTLLEAAIKHNDARLIHQLAQHQFDFNKKTKNGHLPIIKALFSNAFNVVDALLKEGVDSDQRLFSHGKTITHQAAKYGNLNMLRVIDKNKGDLSKRDYLGRTPLKLAIKYKRTDIIDFIQSVNQRDKILTKLDQLIKKNKDKQSVLIDIKTEVMSNWIELDKQNQHRQFIENLLWENKIKVLSAELKQGKSLAQLSLFAKEIIPIKANQQLQQENTEEKNGENNKEKQWW